MHGIFLVLKNPIGALAYFFIILAIVSLWFNRKIWVWGLLFIISYLCAYYGDVATFKSLAPIGVLLFCILCLSQEVPSLIRVFVVLLATGLALAIDYHFISGFQTIEFAHAWQKTPTSPPINLFLHYDQAIAPLFILAFLLPLAKTGKEWGMVLLATIPWTVLTGLVLWALVQLFYPITINPKISSIACLWLFRQLFFIVIPQEALFRGLIQKEIDRGLNHPLSGVVAVLLTSLIFEFIQVFIHPSIPSLLFSFCAGIFYGGIYQLTQRIETSILVHFAVSAAQFFFFA